MIDIRTALKNALQQLGTLNPDARSEAELLLCHVLKKNKAYLFSHPEHTIDSAQLEEYQHLISERYRGVPVAYLTSQREFWSLSLNVNAHTLIPRHETELLVELSLDLMPNKPNVTVLDLGTGSGAIALALAHERPDWQISACDYSDDALKIAQQNAQELGLDHVNFYHSNWFSNLPMMRYDLIISNPPYIPEHDPHLQEGDLRFEPPSALISGQEGLADLQYIINQSCNWLLPNGLLLLEHGYNQKAKISAILNQLAFMNVRCWQDLQGNDRVSGGWRPAV